MKIGKFKLFEKVIIGGWQNPLMIRYSLFGCAAFGIYLHKFMRSDHERALHNHPWPFLAIILKGGYWEVHSTPANDFHARLYDPNETMEWHGPGSILSRPATWKHRVVMTEGTTSWSLCIVGRRVQPWGFFVSKENGETEWCWWRKYNDQKGICEDGILYDERYGGD